MNCQIHQRKANFFCFNQSCDSLSSLCILCLKYDHKLCPEQFIFSNNEILQIQFDTKKENLEQILEVFQNVYTKGKEDLNQHMNEIEKNILEQNKEEKTIKNIDKQTKRYFYDQEQKQIFQIDKNKYNIQEQKELLNYQHIQVQQKIEEFVNQTLSLRFAFKDNFFKDFIFHKKFEKKTMSRIMTLTLKHQYQDNYYIGYCTKPIIRSFSLEIKVQNLNKNDRYCELGFMTKTTLQKYQKLLTGKYLMGDYCYCGYRSKNLSGNFPSLSLSSTQGLEENTIIYFNYKHENKTLTISNSKNNFNVFKSIQEEEIYFYICLYFDKQIAEIKLVNQLIKNLS